MNLPALIKRLIPVLCASLCLPAYPADKPGRQLPLYIKADSIHYNHQLRKSLLMGHVTMDQGETHLKGKQVEIFFDRQNEIKTLIAYGSPARYDSLPKQGQKPLHATARTITYSPKTQSVHLKGNSIVTQGKNRFKSEQIFYNIASKVVHTKSKPGSRTQLHINPSDWHQK